MKLLSLSCLLLLLGLPLPAADHRVLDFEDETILERISGGGRISLSDRHHLGGRQALRWDFSAGDKLEIVFPAWYLTDEEATGLYGAEARTILTLSVYSEKPLPGQALRVEFGRPGRPEPDCSFYFKLNFTGWRSGWIVYSRDMEGTPNKEMSLIRLTAPENGGGGTLYFDNLIPGSITYERFQDRDLQVPMVRDNVPIMEHNNDPMQWIGLEPAAREELTAAETAAFRSIEEQMSALLLGPPEWNEPKFRQLAAQVRKIFEQSGIRRHADGRITGRPLLYGIVWRQYEFVPDRKEQLAEFFPIRELGTAMLNAARICRRAADPALKQEMEAIYYDCLDHLIDQGFAYGSSMGSLAIIGYGTREIFSSFLLMRDSLTARGRNREIAGIGIWQCDLKSYLDEKSYAAPNADYFNIKSRGALISILMMDDVPAKAVYLAGFSHFISRNLAWQTPGWMGGLKPDGCAYHHWGHYPAYFFGGFNGATELCRVLAGSPWAISDAAVANLKHALKAVFLYGNPSLALALEGRRPFRQLSAAGQADNFKLLGEIGHADMAAIYLALAGEKAAAGQFPGVEPASLPQGHWSFNYGGFGIHRYQDKMVTLKTFNRYIWGSEIYRTENRYGRYLSYGAIYILGRGSLKEEGFVEPGWDWNRIPGITAIYRPWEELRSQVPQTEMRTMPENRINGSSSLLGQYGAFGSIITEPDRPGYDPKFRAVQSVFAFGPRLIALGSDLAAGSPHPVETVLFQFGTDDNKRPGFFNSAQPVLESEYEATVSGPAWAADFRGVAYFVLSDSTVKFQRRRQESPNQQNHAMTAGHFNTCVIDHGARPAGAGYEFLVHLDLAPEKAADLAAELARKKPYVIHRQDAAAHAVTDHESGVTAVIAFQGLTEPVGLIESTGEPCYLMYRREKNLLDFSLNTPDLADFISKGYTDLVIPSQEVEAERRGRVVEVTLIGEWQLLGEPPPGLTVKVGNRKTLLQGRFRHGLPVQLKFMEFASAKD